MLNELFEWQLKTMIKQNTVLGQPSTTCRWYLSTFPSLFPCTTNLLSSNLYTVSFSHLLTHLSPPLDGEYLSDEELPGYILAYGNC